MKRRPRTARRARDGETVINAELAEQPNDAPLFEQEPVKSAARRGGALTLTEEEDDFEDGRSSSGLESRQELDASARGEQGSRRIESRSGAFSVEPGEAETAGEPTARTFRRPPEEGAPYVPPGGLARLRKRSRPSKRLSRRPRRRKVSRPSFAR